MGVTVSAVAAAVVAVVVLVGTERGPTLLEGTCS